MDCKEERIMKKRIIRAVACLLTLAMMVSVPVAAFATEWVGSEGESTETAGTTKEAPKEEKGSFTTPVDVVLTENQNGYSSYSGGEVVVELLSGKEVTITEAKKVDGVEWGKFTDAGATAWIKLTTVKVVSEEKPTEPTKPEEPSGSAYPTGVITCNNKVNVRKTPSALATSAIVARLANGTKVTIYESVVNKDTQKTWYRIGTDQWVCKDYVTMSSTGGSESGSGSGSGSGSESGSGTATGKGVIANTSAVNVRSQASTAGKFLGTLKSGTEVTIYETVKNDKTGKTWHRIGTDRWVCGDYVSITGEDGSTTTPETPDTPTGETPIASGTVTSNANLKVRTGPGTNYAIVTSLAKGSKISIYEVKTVNGTQWGRMGKDQWVCLSYVRTDTGSIDVPDSDGSTSVDPNATIVNCSTGVNVRSSAGISGALKGRIAVGARVTIYETTTVKGTKWGRVDNGWVCMDYVKMDADSVEEPDSSTGTVGAPYANVTVPATIKKETTVYASASTTAKKLVVLSAGAEIKITGRALVDGVQWGKVGISGYTGWIQMSDVTLAELSATVSTAQLSAYDKPSTNGKVVVIWGKGQTLKITEQTTDGTYLWGRVETSDRWVNMASLTINTDSSGADTTPAPTISITATVTSEELAVMKEASSGSTKLLGLVKGTKITIEELKANGTEVWGRVTLKNITSGTITGWVKMNGLQQATVSGKVSSDSAKLYFTVGGTASEKSLKKDNPVNVLERTLDASGNLWGKLNIQNVAYWIRMSDVTFGNSSGNSGNNGSTGSDGSSGNNGSTGESGSKATGVVVNTNVLNVRKAAGVANEKVTTLQRGTKVTVYEQVTKDGALWGRIDQGWVSMSYIDLSSKNTGTGTGTGNSNTIMTTVPTGALAVGFVNFDNLIIRSGAGTGYDKVGTLKKGTNVVITEQKLSGGMIWGKIDKGWICTSYVTMTGTSISGSGSSGTVARCAYTVNVRSNPGVGNALVAKILVNSRIEILETKEYSAEQWGRTSLGWISMQYVLLDT